MIRRGCAALALVSAFAADTASAEDTFVELTFDRMPDAAQLAEVEAAFDISAALIADDIARYGFSSRIVAVRPGIAAINVEQTFVLPAELSDADDPASIVPIRRMDGGFDFFVGNGHRIPPSPPKEFGDFLTGAGPGPLFPTDRLQIADGSIRVVDGGMIADMTVLVPDWTAGPDLTLAELDTLFAINDGRGVFYPPLANIDTAVLFDAARAAPDTVALLSGNAGYVRPVTGAPLQVTQGLPDGVVLQQAATGACAATVEDWPSDVEAVIDTIRFSEAVLTESGFRPGIRARILIVDSGLPRALIDNPDFRRVLDVNRLELLAGGVFPRSAEDAMQPMGCNDPDQDSAATAFGYIPRADTQGAATCFAADPYTSIAPPIPTKAADRYEPAHGALVAGLAAGGPALIAAYDDLGAHVGVSIARNVRIITTGEGTTVLSDVTDAADLIERAANPFVGVMADLGDQRARRFDILNLSLSIPASAHSADWQGRLKHYGQRGGLIVVAAGNGNGVQGFELLDAGSHSTTRDTLIETLTRPEGIDYAIVVGGSQLSATGAIEPYPVSNRSAKLVDIVAPATGVASYGLDGGLSCVPGTSIATPQVSFVAAMLVSLGFWNNAEVKRRILATADIEPALMDVVRNGRSLNVVNALDVFADLVWETDPAAPGRIAGVPRRLVFLGPDDTPANIMLQFCQGIGGYYATSQILLWERRAGGLAEVWTSQTNGDLSEIGSLCEAGQGQFRAVDLDTGRIDSFDLSAISRIVPSRFRFGADAVRVATAASPP